MDVVSLLFKPWPAELVSRRSVIWLCGLSTTHHAAPGRGNLASISDTYGRRLAPGLLIPSSSTAGYAVEVYSPCGRWRPRSLLGTCELSSSEVGIRAQPNEVTISRIPPGHVTEPLTTVEIRLALTTAKSALIRPLATADLGAHSRDLHKKQRAQKDALQFCERAQDEPEVRRLRRLKPLRWSSPKQRTWGRSRRHTWEIQHVRTSTLHGLLMLFVVDSEADMSLASNLRVRTVALFRWV